VASTADEIDDRLAGWIAAQPLFFVATAPLAADGHVNVSPKGPIDTLRVLGPHRVAYLDLFGSAAETVAHLRENGRIVVMLCAFTGPPRIVRLHGTGAVVWPEDEGYDELLAAAVFAPVTVAEAQRAVVLVEVDRVGESCGYGVPVMELVGERPHMDLAKRKRLRTMGAEAMVAFQTERNAESLDGLPATRRPGAPTR
jgi:hypothetical protein